MSPNTDEDTRIWLRLMKRDRPGEQGRVAGQMYGYAIRETAPGWNDYYIMQSATKTRHDMTATVRRWQLGGFNPTRYPG